MQGMRDPRLAAHRARPARGVARARRPVRHAAADRPRLGRPERGLGARRHAAPGARGDAEIPPARHRAGGGVGQPRPTLRNAAHRGAEQPRSDVLSMHARRCRPGQRRCRRRRHARAFPAATICRSRLADGLRHRRRSRTLPDAPIGATGPTADDEHVDALDLENDRRRCGSAPSCSSCTQTSDCSIRCRGESPSWRRARIVRARSPAEARGRRRAPNFGPPTPQRRASSPC